MIAGFCHRLLPAAFVALFTTVSASQAQDVPSDIAALKKLVEQQNEQLARLTTEVARLAAIVDRPARPEAPAAVIPATPAAPAAPAVTKEAARPAVVETGKVHIIVKGDSLEKVAKQHGTTIAELQKLNKITDPKKLQIGQQIVLPPNATMPAPAAPAAPAAPENQ